MNKKILLLALGCCSTGINADVFVDTTGATYIESFDISGSELWHNFFQPRHILLAERAPNSQEGYRYINHPPYIEQELPMHRLVCILDRDDGNNQQDRCNDEFPHVHFDDFKMAFRFATETCESYGSSVFPQFVAPSTFVGLDFAAAESHHYAYKLSEGLQFNCVVLATE